MATIKGYMKQRPPVPVKSIIARGYTDRHHVNARRKKFKDQKLQHNVQSEADNMQNINDNEEN